MRLGLLRVLGCLVMLGVPSYGQGDLSAPLYHGGPKKTGDRYLDQVQPILNARCVACHGCYEAPCQVNLQSYEGVRRGFNPTPIFSAKRVDYTHSTRMDDATTIAGWRKLGFLPIVGSAAEPQAADQNGRGSLMYRFLEQASKHHAPGFDPAGAQKIQAAFDAEDKHACVATESQFRRELARSNPWSALTFEQFVSKTPISGMPFGLPRLDVGQEKALLTWLEEGAPGPSAAAQAELEKPTHTEPIEKWEAFLNGASNREKHTARYIYEHVFSAVIHFEENPGELFEIVRSRSAKGPISVIPTELPSQDPLQAFYYRFRKLTRADVQKTHNLWKLSDRKLAHLKKQFLDGSWGNAAIPAPNYATNNIFAYFSPIPAAVRARFLYENSRVIVGAMVQGMVCIGSTATYAIADHFWAWFLKPEMDPSVQQPTLGLASLSQLNTNPEPYEPVTFAGKKLLTVFQHLDLANQEIARRLVRDVRVLIQFSGFDSVSHGGDEMLGELVSQLHKRKLRLVDIIGALQHFLRTTHANQQYQRAFEFQLRQLLKQRGRSALTLDDLWAGDGDPDYPKGDSPNAWLNITRHERSASVQFGPEGGVPQSIWVMTYSNFERLYYNLVAEYKAWGSTTHKMATWRHMSYVRLEGEDLALSFLPPHQRQEIRGWFTHGMGGIKNQAFFPLHSNVEIDRMPARPAAHAELVGSTAADTARKFIAKLRERYQKVAARSFVAADKVSDERLKFEKSLLALQNRRQPFARQLPNIAYVRVQASESEYWVYTLQSDRGYKSHNLMLLEHANRDPLLDSLAVYRGLVGASPEVFLDVPMGDKDRFAAQLGAIQTPQDWHALRDRYGIKRNSDRFWPFFDWLHEFKATASPGNDPLEQGIVNLGHYHFF